MSILTLKIFMEGASTTSLDSQCQCSTTLIIKLLYLRSTLNLPFFSVKHYPLSNCNRPSQKLCPPLSYKPPLSIGASQRCLLKVFSMLSNPKSLSFLHRRGVPSVLWSFLWSYISEMRQIPSGLCILFHILSCQSHFLYVQFKIRFSK